MKREHGTRLPRLAGLVVAIACAGNAWALTDEEIFREFRFNFVIPGGRASGLGGAFVAAADDATAAEANPAALHYISRYELFLEYRLDRPDHEHLAWTAARVESLGEHVSVFNPLFYAGAFIIGAISGAVGDRWSLGFLVETERQVEAHLDGHLRSLPAKDQKSRAVVERMKQDEARHAASATTHGATELPRPLRRIMKLAARAMTFTTYRI